MSMATRKTLHADLDLSDFLQSTHGCKVATERLEKEQTCVHDTMTVSAETACQCELAGAPEGNSTRLLVRDERGYALWSIEQRTNERFELSRPFLTENRMPKRKFSLFDGKLSQPEIQSTKP